MVAMLVNKSITIQDGQNQKQDKEKKRLRVRTTFLKYAHMKFSSLLGEVRKKNALRRTCGSSLQEVLFWDNINYVLVGLIFNMSVKIILSY